MESVIMVQYDIKKSNDCVNGNWLNGDWLDLSADVERVIVDFAKKWCTHFSFALHGNVTYNDTCAYFIECLSPHLRERKNFCGDTASEVFVYTICNESIETIKDIGFDLFVAPDLPEDLSFFYDDATPFLSSITHEGWYALSFDENKLTTVEHGLICSFFETEFSTG